MGRKIGFIGTGNMGASILRGVIRSEAAKPEDILIFDTDSDKVGAMTSETGVMAMESNRQLVELSDYIVLAVKPVYVKQVLGEIKDFLSKDKVLVSIVVGISSNKLKTYIGEGCKVVRTMPNLPLMVGEGMTLISFDESISNVEKTHVKKLFEGSGKVEELEERLMTQVTALTSSSPAYIFMMIEAMADGAVSQGIPRNLAYKLAAQAVLGSAKMVLETGMHPGQLKDQVCSPGGTTIKAVEALEKSGFRYSIINAMNECTAKAMEIGCDSGSK